MSIDMQYVTVSLIPCLMTMNLTKEVAAMLESNHQFISNTFEGESC
jgi:hypothetical protein